MGLFSRKSKAPSLSAGAAKPLNTSVSNASLQSGGSSLKSPAAPGPRAVNRTSAATTGSVPATPLTPFSPVHIPRVDLPKPPDPALDPAGYLRSLGAVRERSRLVTEKALRNELAHFDVDMSKFANVVTFVSQIIKVGYDGKAPLTSADC